MLELMQCRVEISNDPTMDPDCRWVRVSINYEDAKRKGHAKFQASLPLHMNCDSPVSSVQESALEAAAAAFRMMADQIAGKSLAEVEAMANENREAYSSQRSYEIAERITGFAPDRAD